MKQMNRERIEARIKRYQRANFIYLFLLAVMLFGIFVGNSNLILGSAMIFNMIQNELLFRDNQDLEEEISELKENRCTPIKK